MKYISKGLSLNELKGLIKLTDDEIKQWLDFRDKVFARINRLDVKHANKARKLKLDVN